MKKVFFVFQIFICSYMACGQSATTTLKLKTKTFTSHSGQKVIGEVGSLKVPENRANPNSELISIHFTRLKSTNPNSQTPIFYLEGGPGASCSWQAENPRYLESWIPYLELGDVLLLDQRGTGAGRERVSYFSRKKIPENILVDEMVTQKYFKNMQVKALAAFEKRGVDLNGYTTVENAKDIDVLRKELGYEKISIFGFSYGTHLGQTYLKYHGAQVANAVLVGVEGLNHTFKLPSAMDVQFRKIALMAKADANVNQEVPDLIALYKRVVEQLDKTPVEVAIKSPVSRKSMKVKINGEVLNLLLRFDIGDASDIPVFPRFLYSIEKGNYDILRWFVQKRIGILSGIQGMSRTMDAASGATADRLLRIKEEARENLFGNVVNGNMEGDWPTPDLGTEFRAPLITDVRTLFMSGTLDFNTPPYQAEEVRWGFSNSSHIIVDNAGHEQILRHPKASATIIRFLKGENVDDVALFYPKLKFIPIRGETGELSHGSLRE